MKRSTKKLFLIFILFCNICCIIFMMISNLALLLDPYKYLPVALLGILFPLLLTATLLFMFFWLLVKPKNGLISLLAILISIPNIISTFAFNPPAKFQQAKKPGNLRVVTWNVELMNYTAADSVTAIENNAVIFDELHKADADVICLQEFFTAILPGNYYNLMNSIAKSMEYPYYYFSLDIPKFEGKFFVGNIIFSKYKIIDTVKIGYPEPFPGSIIKAGILKNKDTIDIFTTRLQSVNFQSNEYRELNNIKNGSDSSLTGYKNIIGKLKLGYKNRVVQIAIVKKLITESRHPVIFTGDLNDVPVSYTYSELKKDMTDAWVKEGNGLGRTFRFISPTLRIDDIFFNKFFKATQVTRIITDEASDHHGIIADLFLIK